MRPIDADALVEMLREQAEHQWFGSVEERMHFCDQVRFAIDCISDAPTIDAAPVRRSEWVTDDDNTDDWAEPYCKKCGCFIPHGPARFCPNCGSNMRGEIHGTD